MSSEFSKTPAQNIIKGIAKTENIKKDKPINFLLKFNGLFKYSLLPYLLINFLQHLIH
ncbi:MAG: hypothetical protein Q8831_00440 ['Bonamia sp.' little leaf phytoplasma]|nr:hypothetical protein ['Bonamia sp.' little leaf phytoplasma]